MSVSSSVVIHILSTLKQKETGLKYSPISLWLLEVRYSMTLTSV